MIERMGETKRRAPRIMLFVAASVIGAVVLAGGAYAGYKWWQHDQSHIELEADVTSVDLDGDEVLVAQPADPGTTAVIVAHGSNDDREIIRTTYMGPFVQDLLDAGLIVASADASGEAWGNEESQADYVSLSNYLTDELGAERIVFVSFSMGAIASLDRKSVV